jgi:hypothetical protein
MVNGCMVFATDVGGWVATVAMRRGAGKFPAATCDAFRPLVHRSGRFSWHYFLGINSAERARQFYDPVFALLGFRLLKCDQRCVY